jgi:hypothetical protein
MDDCDSTASNALGAFMDELLHGVQIANLARMGA